MERADSIGNIDMTLLYDPDVLRATGVIKGSLTTDSMLEANILTDTVRIGIVDSTGISNDGSVVYVRFDVIGSDGMTSPLTIKEVNANRVETFDELLVLPVDGVFTVGAPLLLGDCNGDGVITSADALMALQMSVGAIEVNLIADMDGDGQVTSVDASMILSLVTEKAALEWGSRKGEYTIEIPEEVREGESIQPIPGT
jgi:TolB protein